ncbi:MAG: hypothetical protein QNL33_04040 [Akkermansiaceae bacterium]|jgi:hypothetical protein
MRKITIIALFGLTFGSLSAREWRSTDGKKSFEASYVSNDGKLVTLRKGNGIVTLAVDKLHEDDQTWINTHHPAPADTAFNGGDAGKPGVPQPAPKGAAFDTLEFGDTRSEVLEKLNASPMVDGSVAEAMLARVGLNGIYRTKQTIGGLHCHLYFDWDGSNRLKEVTLRTNGKSIDSYGGLLKSNWSQMIELLTMLHGDAINRADYPSSDDLQDGLILNSHLWRTEDGHSVILGTGQEGNQYCVSVRITVDRIEPVPLEK